MIRTFIATKLSESCRQSLVNLTEDLKKSSADVRWVVPGNVHLTLKFLGNVEEERIEEIAHAVSRACEGIGPFKMSLQGLGAFPSIRRPRIVWVGIEKGQDILMTLNMKVEDELLTLGFEREKRKFSPHLTMGRLRRQGSPGDLTDRLSVVFYGGECLVERVYMVKSTLTPEGPVYEDLAYTALEQEA